MNVGLIVNWNSELFYFARLELLIVGVENVSMNSFGPDVMFIPRLPSPITFTPVKESYSDMANNYNVWILKMDCGRFSSGFSLWEAMLSW